jgi:hypothetical protein
LRFADERYEEVLTEIHDFWTEERKEKFKKMGFTHKRGIILYGEAGVGKSRLLLEMVNRLPEDGFQYLEGRCLQYGGSMLYLPILDVLRSIFKIKDDDKEFQIKRKISESDISCRDLPADPTKEFLGEYWWTLPASLTGIFLALWAVITFTQLDAFIIKALR